MRLAPSSRRAGRAPRARPLSSAYAVEPLECRRLLALTVPAFSSTPGAAQTLYLDFNGSGIFNWVPDGGEGYLVRGPSPMFQNLPAPAFSIDADVNNFSAAELAHIHDVWSWVAEKFSPFTINVTTVDPGIVRDSQNMTVQIGGSNEDWYGGFDGPVLSGTPSFGAADLDGFYDGGENIGFVFSADPVANGLSGGRLTQFVGESAAQMAGRMVGLKRQRHFGGEFNPGDAGRAPIMGGSNNNTSARGIWWTKNLTGPISPDPVQDDLLALTQDAPQRLFYRGAGGTTNLSFNSAGVLNPVAGVITRTGELDAFTFTATGARATFSINNAAHGGMLAPTASIRISSTSTLVPATVTLNGTSAIIEATNLTVGGNYVLQVGSQGGYGDVGQYRVTGAMQQFASYDAASRTVFIGGLVGNNNVTLRNFAAPDRLVITNSLNGGPTATQSFPLAGIDNVVVALGSGNDIVNLFGLYNAARSGSLNVQTNLGGGADTLRPGDGNSGLVFNVNPELIEWVTPGGDRSYVRDVGAERIDLIGTGGNDLFNINYQNLYSSIHAYGDNSDDRLVIGPDMIDTSRPIVTFHGGQNVDTLEMNGAPFANGHYWNAWGTFVSHHVPGGQLETHFDDTVERISIRGGAGDDSLTAYSVPFGQTVILEGNGGDDNLYVGYDEPGGGGLPFSSDTRGTASLIGGDGEDHVIIADETWESVGNYAINATSVRNTFVNNAAGFDGSVERVDLLSRGGNTTTVAASAGAPKFRLFDAGGNGIGSLVIADNTFISSTFEMNLYGNRIARKIGNPQLFREYEIEHYGYESLTVRAGDQTRKVNVRGTSADIPAGRQTTLVMSAGHDVVTLFPTDADGNPTILTPLGVFGGAGTDAFIIDNSASATPSDYLINNAGGSTTANVFGIGPSGVGAFNDVEQVSVLAGSGNDSFDVASFKSGTGLTLAGNGGDDVLNFGADALAANVTNISGFTFNGGEGADTFNLRNATTADSFTYPVSPTAIAATRTFPSPYSLTLNRANVETMAVFAGSNFDVLNPSAVGAGQTLDFHGGNGDDAINMPTDSLLVAGRLNFFGDGGTANRINQIVNSKTTPSVLHIGAGAVGAAPGDTFYAPGGSLHFDSVQTVNVRLGNAADTVYAQPDAVAAISIVGADPTASPGDQLNLALAGVPDAQVNGTAASGSLTSSDRRTLSWSGFEDGPIIDDVAPAVVASPFSADADVQSIDITFSEDPGALLTAADFTLVNLTTGETVASENIEVVYDAATLTARLTFPGYPNGVLPDGDYRLSLPAVTDAFGNAGAAGEPLEFFVLAGDANCDRTVNFADLVLLAQNYNQAGKSFSQGNFNYSADGKVDFADLVILAQRYNKSLAALAPAAPLTVAGRSSSTSPSALTTKKAKARQVTVDQLQ